MNEIRVLLVDDDRRFCENAVLLLSREKIAAEFVCCGEACLERMQQVDFDVVVLDQRMPGLSGTQTLRQLREEGCLAEALLLTGHASVGDAFDITKLNAADYLLKPVSMADLAIKIKSVFERKKERERNIPD